MIFYLNNCVNKTDSSKLTLKEETRYDDYLKLMLRLSYKANRKSNEFKTIDNEYDIPLSIIEELCNNNDDNPINFIKMFFNHVLDNDIKFQINKNKLFANIDDIQIMVIENKYEMDKFRDGVIYYYQRCKNNKYNNNPGLSSTMGINTEIDEEINKLINECVSMEVPLFKCGTVVLVKDFDTYNRIINVFNFPEIKCCLGTMETLCSNSKRYYILGIFNDSLTTFVHELTHLAFHIHRDTSMKINSGEGNETFAYLVDHFFQEWQHLFTNRCD